MLRSESDNPYGVQGKAVGVWLDDLKLGHVSNKQVSKVFQALAKAGGNIIAPGLVTFASKKDDLEDSVEISIKIDSSAKAQKKSKGNHEY